VLKRLLIGMIIALLIGCGNTNKSPINPIHAPALLTDQSILVGNDLRTYHLYLPNDPLSAAVVFLFHGNSGSSDQILGLEGTKAPYKVWMDIALQENLILVVPNGAIGSNNKRGWNDCRVDAVTNHNADDVLFFTQLHDLIISRYGDNKSRAYVNGISNGGLMVQRLSNEAPERLLAVASVVASKALNSECIDSSVPLPVLIMNGTADPILPYEGGHIGIARGEVFSTDAMVNYWVSRNQLSANPTTTVLPDIDQTDYSSVQRHSYTGGVNEAAVMHYEVVNGGHTEPSIQERYSNLYKLIVGNQNGDIEMAQEIWGFFRALSVQ